MDELSSLRPQADDIRRPPPEGASQLGSGPSLTAGLETLDFHFSGGRPAGAFAPVLVGVLGSGNLEVLLEAAPGSTGCTLRIETSARGFGAIWQAVVADFHERHGLAGVRVSVNDMGATPAVVSLRLDQAVAEINGVLP